MAIQDQQHQYLQKILTYLESEDDQSLPSLSSTPSFQSNPNPLGTMVEGNQVHQSLSSFTALLLLQSMEF